MKNQKSILGFFSKSPSTPSPANTQSNNAEPASSPAQRASQLRTSMSASSSKAAKPATKGRSGNAGLEMGSDLTPAPSSDAFEESEVGMNGDRKARGRSDAEEEGLPSPITSTENGSITPSRRVSYFTRLY